MNNWVDFSGFEERRGEWLREAEERRLARESRRGSRGESSAERVRWGLRKDEPGIAELLQLNGMPRWVAFEERFIVAERGGRILAALRYRTESKRLMLGLLVVDPWAGERSTARALYAGALDLGREMGVSEVLATSGVQEDYPGEAGYRRWGRGWRMGVAPATGGAEEVVGGLRYPVMNLKELGRALFGRMGLR